MEKYIYDNSNGLWYELHGDYYLPCLVILRKKYTLSVSGQKAPAVPQRASSYGL